GVDNATHGCRGRRGPRLRALQDVGNQCDGARRRETREKLTAPDTHAHDAVPSRTSVLNWRERWQTIARAARGVKSGHLVCRAAMSAIATALFIPLICRHQPTGTFIC